LKALHVATLDELFGGQFRLDLDDELLGILTKIKAATVPLRALYTPTFGLRACSKQLARFDKRHFIKPRDECRRPVRYLEADELTPTGIAWRGRWLDYQPEAIYSARTPELFVSPKLLVPSLLASKRLSAIYDDQGFFADQSLVCISPAYKLPPLDAGAFRPSLLAVARQINSAVLSFYFAHAIVGEALGGGAIHATPGLIGQLPIFVNPALCELPDTALERALFEACDLTAAEAARVSKWRQREAS
jgi:hypothetical protein